MSELKVILATPNPKMKNACDGAIEVYLKSEADELISTIRAERDEYRYNLSCARNEIHNLSMSMREDVKTIADLKDKLRHYPMMAALIESGNKEIAELKDKLQAADKQIENLITSASNIMLAQDSVNDTKCAELRRHKYKRCLAIAERCKYRMYYLSTVVDYELSKLIPNPTAVKRYTKKESRMDYWKNLWLELAEKFKEAK